MTDYTQMHAHMDKCKSRADPTRGGSDKRPTEQYVVMSIFRTIFGTIPGICLVHVETIFDLGLPPDHLKLLDIQDGANMA